MSTIQVVSAVKSLKDIESYDEITTRQTIILQMLQALGWSIFDREEVIPEFAVEGRRVDYCLRVQGKSLYFIEAKRPSEKLEKHEEHEKQLLDYAYYEGVKLALLTNGITWWFYLPMIGENWRTRKFLAIDVYEQQTELVASRFDELLGRESVRSGKALAGAETIHQSKKKTDTIARTLPEAWNEMIGEPDTQLLDILLNTTERICGFRPSSEDATQFLTTNRDGILLDTDEAPPNSSTSELPKRSEQSTVPFEDRPAGRGGGRISVKLDGKQFDGTSVATLYYAVLKYVVDSGSVAKVSLPWGTGSKRYFAFKGQNPVHMNSRPFRAPVTYRDYHLESHVNRSQGVRFLGAFCLMLGYDFKVVEV